MTLNELKNEVRKAGFTPSAGSFEDEVLVYVCSTETAGPATFGHPIFEASFNKLTGWVRIGSTKSFQKKTS